MQVGVGVDMLVERRRGMKPHGEEAWLEPSWSGKRREARGSQEEPGGAWGVCVCEESLT